MLSGLPRRWRVMACAVSAAGLAAIIATAPAMAQQQVGQRVSIAVIGDLGYFPEQQQQQVDNVLADIGRDTALSFVAHLGDLSRPIHACRPEFIRKWRESFDALPHAVIFTPGDNDWTDCHDDEGVKGGNPSERLADLRAVMFPTETSLGKRAMPVLRQSRDSAHASYRENARWDVGGVTFLTLHVVGSNNNRGRTPDSDAEYEARNAANLAWLRQGFAHAVTAGSRGVMVLQQANLWPEITPNAGAAKDPSGFAELRAALEKEVAAFGRPVVIMHGDSHFFRIDNAFHKRPPRGQPGTPAPANFTRVEIFGTPNHHWLHVTIDPDDPNVFTFRPRIVAANVPRKN